MITVFNKKEGPACDCNDDKLPTKKTKHGVFSVPSQLATFKLTVITE